MGRSKKNTTNNVNAPVVEPVAPVVAVETCVCRTMHNALVWAYNDSTMSNSHAITKTEASAKGVGEGNFKQWVEWNSNLLEAVGDYLKLVYDKGADDEARDTAYNKLYPLWRKGLCNADLPHDKRLFVTKHDINVIIGYGNSFINTERGAKACTQKLRKFRQSIERYVGIKLSGDGMLSKTDAEAIGNYLKAVKAIQKADERLEDSKDESGNTVMGLRSQRTALDNELANYVSELTELGLTEEQVKLTKRYSQIKDSMTSMDNDIKQAEGSKSKAEKRRDKYAEAYKSAIDTLHIIDPDAKPEEFASC